MSEFKKFNLSLDDGKEFIDSKILDFISGNTLQNCQQKLTSIVAEMVVGTTLKTDDLIQKLPIKGQPQGSVFVASKIMKLLILPGYKDLPWNEKRRKFVAKYFNTRFFLDVGTFTNDKFSSQHEMVEETPLKVTFQEEEVLQKTPEVNNAEDQQRSDLNNTQLQLKRWHRTNKKTFWTKVLNFARMHGIPIHGLATILKEQHQKRSMWRKRSASGNHIRDLFTGLLEDRGSSECFRYELSK